MIDTRTLRNLKKSTTTTRGLPRQRALKGSAQSLRRQVLQELELEALERMLAGKFKRLADESRARIEAELNAGQDRHVALVEILSQWGSG